MVARAEDSNLADKRATGRSHQRSATRYSIRQRLTFVLALVVFAAASFYAGGAMLTRAYPALFPGENAPFSAALGRLPGPVKVEQPDDDSVFNQRRNILIIGLDKRPDEPMLGEYRTDVIMVATIDPVYNSVNILSFPRDMYIDYRRAGWEHLPGPHQRGV
ncbi:MAG: hypothetical protein U5Q44_05395 [Dehalococcoidia bacterium]|nr:hypothetical protein [Dehalococcoidia bacterium]